MAWSILTGVEIIASHGIEPPTAAFLRLTATAIALLQDIAGGGVIASPGGADLMSPLTGPLVRKYFAGAAGVPAEDRLRMFNLTIWSGPRPSLDVPPV